MARVTEDPDLRRLIAEVEDDLAQMAGAAAALGARLPALEGQQPSEETIAFVALGLHRWYTAAEAAFERIERTLVGPSTATATWHTDLLRLMTLAIEGGRPAVVRAEVARALAPYLRFRHFLRHAYGAELEAPPLVALVRGLAAVHAEVDRDLRAFVGGVRASLGA